MTCDFTYDDGAYVLGALGPSERAAFERHLPDCVTCRGSVASLAVLPGLLGRLDAASVAAGVAAPPSLLRRTLSAAASRRRAERRRRISYAVAGALASVLLATGTGVGVHLAEGQPAGVTTLPAGPSSSTGTPGQALASMRPVSSKAPVTAEIGLVATEGGTRIDMTCRYASGPEGKWLIRLVVYPRWGSDGEQIGTWTATSGQILTLSAITHLSPPDIARVELQRADTTPLLTWTPA